MRFLLPVVVAALLVAACGSPGLSMSEYVDRINEMNDEYGPQAEAAWVEFLELPEPTTGDFKTLADHQVTNRVALERLLGEVDPPREIAELHDLLTTWVTALRQATEAMAGRAGTVTGWDELLQSAEYRRFESTLIGGAEMCDEFQAKLDAAAAREGFAVEAWLVADLEEVADAVMGCDSIPEDLDTALGR